MIKIDQAKKIFQRCSFETELTNSEIKSMFKTIALCLEDLHDASFRQAQAVREQFEERSRALLKENQDRERLLDIRLRDIEGELRDRINLINEKMMQNEYAEENRQRYEAEISQANLDGLKKEKNNQQIRQLHSIIANLQKQVQPLLTEKRLQEKIEREREQQLLKEKERKERESQQLRLKQIQLQQEKESAQQQNLRKAVVEGAQIRTDKNIKDWSSLSRVQELNLYQCRLEKLPDSIGQLTNLQQLDLGYNNLQQLPASMAGLANLTLLSIYSNKLTEFPQFIRGLHKLKTLSIWGNKMVVESEWVLSLKALKLLQMSKYQLPGEQQIQLLQKECNKSGIRLSWWG